MGFLRRKWGRVAAIAAAAFGIWSLGVRVIDAVGRADTLGLLTPDSFAAKGLAWLLSTPAWVPGGCAIFLSLVVAVAVTIDIRRGRNVAAKPEKRWDQRELHDRAAAWLRSHMSSPNLKVRAAFLFGSIMHEHYETSDVDVIVRFGEMSERQLKKAATKIKADIARDFERTFGHRLHATFFCSHENSRMDEFMARAGKTEKFYALE